MWKKSRVLFLATVQSDVHQCTRRLVFPLGVTRASPAKIAACIALLVKLMCESITHCALSLSTLLWFQGWCLTELLSEVVRVCGDKQWISPLWFHVCWLFRMGRLSHISNGRSIHGGALCPVSSNSSHCTLNIACGHQMAALEFERTVGRNLEARRERFLVEMTTENAACV